MANIQENKCEGLLCNMEEQKAIMKSLYQHKSDDRILCEEKSVAYASHHWDTVYSHLSAHLERIKIANLKGQHRNHVIEKDVVNSIKMLEQLYAILMECNSINQQMKQTCSTIRNNAASPSCFGNQMVEVRQHIDLLSFEMTKLKTVNEALHNIISNYKLEIAAETSDQENDEED